MEASKWHREFKWPYFIFLFLMQMEMSKLKLLGRGSNSEIYRYGGEEQGVVLKMVGAGCSKEAKHLANEHRMLSSLSH